MDEKQPYKPKGFFKPGNTYGKGRPRVSLSKPDVLLPAIFNKAGINWALDFTRLYKAMKQRKLTDDERTQYQTLLSLLPYLIVKVALKEGDLKAYLDKGGAVSAAKATKALLDALENESNVKSRATGSGQGGSLESGKSTLPSPPQSA